MRLLTVVLLIGVLFAACSAPGSDGDSATPTPGDDLGGQQAATTPVITGDGSAPTPAAPQTDGTPPTTQGIPPTNPPPTEVVSVAQEGLLPSHRIIAFYGHPSTPTMGVLGSGTKEEVLAGLRQQEAEFLAVDPNTPNKLAFEIIATVAQPTPGADGTYLLYTGDEWIGEYVDFATANDMIVILDLQIGHNSIENEINRVRHWLALPNVHVALDPEFATKANDIPRPDRVPGTLIGEISGYQVQTAIDMVAEIVAENNIPSKILIVHQFEEEMIYEKHVIVPKQGVDLVVDMDGFGAPAHKIEGYELYVTDELIQYGGIKLFYEQDDPLMDPTMLLSLNPHPVVVIYQ